jgi:hypothetical protein
MLPCGPAEAAGPAGGDGSRAEEAGAIEHLGRILILLSVATPAVVAFVELFLRTGALQRAGELAAQARKAVAVVGSGRISDHWKERVLKRYSRSIMLETLRVTLLLAVSLAGAAAAYLLAGLALLGADRLGPTAYSWEAQLAALVVGVAYGWLRKRTWGTRGQGADAYSPLDKALHFIALEWRPVRAASLDMDCGLAKPDPAAAARGSHVFIAGLARAGTSILFRSLYATGGYAALTYRHMPFVLAPTLWTRVTRGHRLEARQQERAHGDGLQHGFDTPEAFEEVFWLTFCGPDYLGPDRLTPHEAGREELERLRLYIADILSLPENAERAAYLSKNNNNILRLPSVARAFPGAALLVPFRSPHDHACSLLRQHRNFRRQQEEDPFTLRYMSWLGHYEFGLGHRPFVFQGGQDAPGQAWDPESVNYWLALWLDAYRHLLALELPGLALVDYEAMCRAPEPYFRRLARRVGLDPDTLARQAPAIREPRPYPAPPELDQELLQACQELHARLRRAALAA